MVSALRWVQHLVVERFEMMRAQPPDRDATDHGQDVPVDLASIAVPGAPSQVDLLSGEPLGGQIGAEGERTHLVVTSVDLGGQASSELFSLFAGGAGRIPS